MSMIKKFFEKKKLDRKFKKAGEGHVLNTPKSSGGTPVSALSSVGSAGTRAEVCSRAGQSAEQQRAAEAALLRISSQSGWSFIHKHSVELNVYIHSTF